VSSHPCGSNGSRSGPVHLGATEELQTLVDVRDVQKETTKGLDGDQATATEFLHIPIVLVRRVSDFLDMAEFGIIPNPVALFDRLTD